MSGLRWSIAAVLLVGAAAIAAPRLWSDADEPIGTASPIAAEHFHRGQAELRRLEVDAARASLRRSVEADPEFAMARFELGHALVWLGERDAGVAQIRTADSLAVAPGLTTELERLVIGLAAATLDEDEARAGGHFERLVSGFPDHPESLRLQARRAMEEGDADRARELYRRVLAADPERVEIHNTLGYLALNEGRYEDAVASFKRYAYFAADAANPHDSLGEAYLWTGRYHESIEQYQEALRIDPSFLTSVVGATDALSITGQVRLARRFLENFTGLFERRGQLPTFEAKMLQVDYRAEDWLRVVRRSERLRADEEAFAGFEPGLRLWVNALGAVALAELGRARESTELATAVAGEIDALMARIGDGKAEAREELQLLQASLDCRLALLAGRPAARELATLRGLIEASTRQPHRLLPYQGVLVQSLHDAGLDTEALEFAPRVLTFNPHHPRTLLASAEAEARRRDRGAALGYLQRYLDVMHKADENHPPVQRARQLLDQLAPSS